MVQIFLSSHEYKSCCCPASDHRQFLHQSFVWVERTVRGLCGRVLVAGGLQGGSCEELPEVPLVGQQPERWRERNSPADPRAGAEGGQEVLPALEQRFPAAHGADHGEALFAAFISWDKPVPGYVLVLDDAQYQSNLLNQKTRSLV